MKILCKNSCVFENKHFSFSFFNERKSQCILFNMKEKCEKISNIEVVEEIKYLGVIVQAKRNVFEGQKNEMMKKKSKD